MKHKKHTLEQKELLNLFNSLLDVILTDETLMSSKDENENDKTLMSSNEDNGNENENDSENENEDDDDTMSQNEKYIRIKNINDYLDEITDKLKSFEDQIKSIRKVENLGEYYFSNEFGDKELKFKCFKLELAHLANIIDERSFEQIFGHKFETLVNKLINTTNKEENQTIVNNINKNKEKRNEEDETYNYVIQASDQRIDLIDAIKLILNFNETI